MRCAALGCGREGRLEDAFEIDQIIRQLMDWLQNYTNRMLLIRKQEDGNRDLVRILLEEVGYRPSWRSIDGYTDGPALVLHGVGALVSGAGEMPLPSDLYSIALSGVQISRIESGGVLLQSDRARYEVSPLISARR